MVALTGTLVPQLVAVVKIGFHADDRLDPRLFHLLVKIDGAEHVAVIGNRHRIHPQLFEAPGQFAYLVGSVKK